jgi:beta-fructofuranosidase
MVFIPRDHFLWDYWFAPRKPGEPYHLFYLRAPRSLPDPELRHGQAHIGHAVSDDLITWQELPEAFAPGAEGLWDDRAIWTGSIIVHQNRYYWI